jgi:hypothetical protein
MGSDDSPEVGSPGLFQQSSSPAGQQASSPPGQQSTNACQASFLRGSLMGPSAGTGRASRACQHGHAVSPSTILECEEKVALTAAKTLTTLGFLVRKCYDNVWIHFIEPANYGNFYGNFPNRNYLNTEEIGSQLLPRTNTLQGY